MEPSRKANKLILWHLVGKRRGVGASNAARMVKEWGWGTSDFSRANKVAIASFFLPKECRISINKVNVWIHTGYREQSVRIVFICKQLIMKI